MKMQYYHKLLYTQLTKLNNNKDTCVISMRSYNFQNPIIRRVSKHTGYNYHEYYK